MQLIPTQQTGTEFDLLSNTDNCGILSVTNNLNSTNTLAGYVFPLGNTTVTWTVTDIHTNVSTCSLVVTVIMAPKYSISGKLQYYHTTPTFAPVAMNNVTLTLSPGGQTAVTGADGSYTFTNLCDGSYTIAVTANGKSVGGINSTDAGAANSWSTVGGLIEHVKFLAGDVAGPGGVPQLFINSTDALRIQQYFVYGTAFDRSAWSYWKKGDLVLSNYDANRLITTFPAVIASANVSNFDLYGMVTGDFNGSFTPSAAKSAASTLNLTYGDHVQVAAGQEFELPIRSIAAMEVGAVSLILDVPSDLVEVEDVIVNGSSDPVSYAVIGNELRIGWNTLI